MKLLRVAQRCVSDGSSHIRLNRLQIVKTFSTNSIFGNSNDNQNTNSSESFDDVESRIFGDQPSDDVSFFFQKLDRIGNRAGGGMYSDRNDRDKPNIFGDYESSSTLTDGLDGRLKEAATYFEVDKNEIAQDDYTFRPDMNLKPGMTYTPEDLNLRKPGVWKPSKRLEFEVTTEEVLRKADFRNVRFLANFLTEAGIIIKRSKTGISAKAQRKVAREIKTARAFGLLPFTTMGTKSFVFGQTMENLDKDFALDDYDTRVDVDDIQDATISG